MDDADAQGRIGILVEEYVGLDFDGWRRGWKTVYPLTDAHFMVDNCPLKWDAASCILRDRLEAGGHVDPGRRDRGSQGHPPASLRAELRELLVDVIAGVRIMEAHELGLAPWRSDDPGRRIETGGFVKAGFATDRWGKGTSSESLWVHIGTVLPGGGGRGRAGRGAGLLHEAGRRRACGAASVTDRQRAGHSDGLGA